MKEVIRVFQGTKNSTHPFLLLLFFFYNVSGHNILVDILRSRCFTDHLIQVSDLAISFLNQNVDYLCYWIMCLSKFTRQLLDFDVILQFRLFRFEAAS